jgi:hypothetical protein
MIYKLEVVMLVPKTFENKRVKAIVSTRKCTKSIASKEKHISKNV